MKLIKAFTLVECMVSIFIFSAGMLGFMAYHTRSTIMMFENESAQLAHALALNLADEINSLSGDDLRDMKESLGTGLNFDNKIADFIDKGTGTFNTSPFNSFGISSTSDSYLLYRMIQADSYSNKTQTANPEISHLGLLWHFDILVGWPKKGYPSKQCNSMGESECNYVRVPIVKPVSAP
jgi:type II secretory pathway pseudopilin PulG